MSSRINVGKVAPIPKGNWVQNQSYEKLNMVNNGGVLYIAKEDVPANTAITNTNYWMPASGKFSIGTVETVSSSTGASATITDGAEGPILNLNIPRGVTGNESIDDTKGEGDTDYVWSADKTAKITNDLINSKLDTTKTAELSSSIVTFEAENDHAIKDLTVAIEPVQDLHGYDTPWPADGGKNLLPPTIYNFAISNNKIVEDDQYRSMYCKVTPGNVYTISRDTVSGNRFRLVGTSDEPANGVSSTTFVSADTTGTLSETITIPEGYNYLLIYLSNQGDTITSKIQIELGSTATSWTPYSNICPISGWTGCNVQRTGKNLVNYDQWKTVSVVKGTAVWENNGVTLTATSNDCYTSYNLTRFRIPVVEGKTYILSWEETTNASGSIYIFNQEKLTQLVAVNNSNAKELSWTIPEGVKYITYRFGVTSSGTTISYKNIMIRESTTSGGYESSQYTTLPISWETEAGTVYGGSLNVLTGLLTVTKAYKVLTGNENWEKTAESTNNNVFRVANYMSVLDQNGQVSSHCLFLATAYSAVDSRANTFVQGESGNLFFQIPKTLAPDTASWKAYLSAQATANTPVTFVANISPQTIPLTPSQMQTLLGENHIWADIGDSTVTLRLPTGDLAYQDTVDYETQVTNKPDSAPVITEIASGSIASFSDGSTLPVGSLTVGIEPVQEGTGDPSPENICPIYGWTSAQIFKTRKNLLNPANFNATRVTVDENGIYTFTAAGYNADLYTGQNGSHIIPSSYFDKLPYLPAGTYTWSFKYISGGAVRGVSKVDKNGNRTSLSSSYAIKGDYYEVYFTLTEPSMINIERLSNAAPGVFSEPQLELGTQRTAYEPYVGSVLPIDFPVSEIAPDGIYYGGTVDVLAGTMMVNSNFFTFDGSDDEGWEYYPDYSDPENNIYGYRIENYFQKNYYAGPNSKTNLFTYSSNQSGSQPLNTYSLRNYNKRIVVSVSIDNLQDFKTFLGTNNLQLFVYYYQKPVDTVQTTPAQMQTLLGENHIWADTGDTAVTYRADSKLYIDQAIAESQRATRKMIADSATADGKAPKSLATGDLIIVGNELRKATESIGQGSKITDQRSTVATLADVIKALQQ